MSRPEAPSPAAPVASARAESTRTKSEGKRQDPRWLNHPSRPTQAPISRGICEFGECMAQLLEQLPHARGAVLSDGYGEPIDAAHRIDLISEIDIQIAGAQIGQALARVRTGSTIFGLGAPTVITECDDGMIIARPLLDEYLLTLVSGGSASLSRALRAFEACAQELITHM